MSLAIVIPAYKSDFFDKALNSLNKQTNKNFNLYIGDDNSPENIYEISKKYENSLNIKYHRFENNLGGKDLVGQWNRCVTLINDEEWIWLFSDDDIVEDNCVQVFYDTLDKTNRHYDVYRFDTVVIDKDDNITTISPESPYLENFDSLCLNILLGKRGNSMPDHIFKRTKYIEIGGFVNFAYGQSADWATSITFANPNGLITMPFAKVRWRYSGVNLSSIAYKKNNKMIGGFLSFIVWINEVLLMQVHNASLRNEIKEASLINLTNILGSHYKKIPLSKILPISKLLIGKYGFNSLKALNYCLKINRNQNKFFNKISRIKRRLISIK